MNRNDWARLIDKSEGGEELFFVLSGLADWAEERGIDTTPLRFVIEARKRPYYYSGEPLPYTWNVHPNNQWAFLDNNSLPVGWTTACLANGTPWGCGSHALDYHTKSLAYLDLVGLFHAE